MNPDNFFKDTAWHRLLLFLSFAVLAGTFGFFHEPWRDEMQAWLLVQDSETIRELMANSAYEGHPSLWFFLLWGLKQVAPGLEAMRVLHLAIATGTAWLVIYRAPFPLWQRALLVSGYFFFYEYTFIARNYAPGIFLLMAFCALFPRRESPVVFFLMGLAVAGMMLSSFYAFFLGLACLATLAAEEVLVRRRWRELVRRLPGYIVMTAGVLLFLADTLPPDDYGYAFTWNLAPGADGVIALLDRVCCVFLPLPERTIHFWNTILFPNRYLRAAAGLAILAAVFLLFARKPLARWFIGAACAMLLLFSLVKFGGYYRHNGHLFIAFVAMLWMQYYMPGKEPAAPRLRKVLLAAVLVVQAMAALMATAYDTVNPFSQSRAAGEYIARNFPGAIVVADEDAAVSPVSAWLPRKPWYPVAHRYGTFIIWNKARLQPKPTTADLTAAADSLSRAEGRETVILTNYLPAGASGQGLRLERYFGPSVEPAESYYLFTFSSSRHTSARGCR